MEWAAKDSQLANDAVQKLHRLIQLLTNSENFRKNLPEALRLLNQSLGTSNAFLFEITPIHLNTPHLVFDGILQVPLIGSPQEHTIPDQLTDISFSTNLLETWLKKIEVVSKELVAKESVNEEADPNNVIFGTFETIEKASESIDITTIIKVLGISENSFALFPLRSEKKTIGCLFFLHSNEEEPWDAKAIDLAYSGTALITNLLKQQRLENKEAFLALEKSEERYRNFIAFSSEGIYYTNCRIPISIHLPIEEQTELFYKNAYIEKCNLVMAKMYGFSSEHDMIGSTIQTLHQGEFYELNKSSFREIAKNSYQIEDTETIEFNLNGEKRYFLNRGLGIIEQDHLIGMWGVQRDITEKRLAEIAFEKNESRYSSIVKNANMGLWDWQLKPRIMQVNETFLEILELEGKNQVFKQTKILALIHPDDFLALRNATEHHIKNQTDNYQMTVRLKAGTGEWRWYQIYGRLVEEAPGDSSKRVSGMLLDVHQQKTTEILLQKGEELLKAVLDAMPDTKLHVKLDGSIRAVYSSSQSREENTYFAQNVIGKKLQEVMPVFTAKGLLFNAAEAIKTKTLQTFEYINIVENATYYFEARINQVNEDEAIIILRDITSIKKIENDLNEQVYKHDQNVRELKKYIDSNLQLENFAYIASHDLREPIRTMRMFGQFLKKNIGGQLDEENLLYLDFIISGAKRMNELIEGILTYSRVDTDPLEKETIITADLLADSIDNLSKAIEKQKAVVVIDEIPLHIYGSRIRLEQVFQNLIANGIKFSRPNIPPQIVISGHETKNHWVFEVADNGIGIKKDFFDQIFVLFKKLHNNKDFAGAGIGLALLKRIVEQHEGEIWLESEENVGTTFLFSLSKSH